MKIKKIVFIIFIFLSKFSVAQQKGGISGIVRDDSDGSVLTGVTVFVEALNKGTTTDADGHYELLLPSGKHAVSFSFVGYVTVKQDIVIENQINKLNIKLKPENKFLDEVVVTSKKKDANVRELVMSTQKLEMVSVRKIPALMGEVDVIKAVQLLPGVIAASEGSSNFSVRGGSPDQNLILIDGAPVYNASHFLGFFSVFNNDVVKDATLIKADIPASYESRLSSVMDIKTLDEVPTRLNMTGGIGLLTTRLMVNTPVYKDKTSVMLAGRVTYGGLLASLVINKLSDVRLYFYDLNGKIMHVFNDNNRLFVSGYYGNDIFGMNNLMRLSYGNRAVTMRWNHIFGDRLTSNLSFIYSKYRYTLGVEMDPFDFTVAAGIKDYTGKYDFTMLWNDKITSHFGISATMHHFSQGELDDRNGAIAMYLETDATERIIRKALEYALFFSQEHKITPLFSIRYGLRCSMFQNIGKEEFFLFDENHKSYGSIIYPKGKIFHTEAHLEPRLGMMYMINEFSSVKASYSRTVQYAQLASNATAGLPFDVWFPTSPNVKPQKCDQFTLGYFRNFRHNEIETSAEVFYKNINDVIDFADDAYFIGNEEVDGEVRVGKGRAFGIEFMVRKDVGKLTGWVSYTYSRSLRTVPEINFGKEYVSSYDRPHCVSIVLNYAFNERLDVSANWIYNTGQPVTYPYGKFNVNGNNYAIYNGSRNKSRYPAYHRLDLSATWKCKDKGKRWKGEWSVSLYNVYGRHNTWAVIFTNDKHNPETIKTEKMYLFSIVPSISYNFKF